VKKIISILCCISFIFTLSACTTTESGLKKFDTKAQSGVPSNSLIAENENYKLEFDQKTGGVFLTELSSGEKWGTSPVSDGEVEYDEYGIPIKKHPKTQSPVTIRYRDYKNNSIYQVLSFSEVISGGRIRCAKGENSLLVEYYFDTAKIMIPVEYKLLNDSVQITVDPKRIQENENTLFEVSVAPFWCSAKNNSEDSYLFVPSGSGALVSTEERSQQGEAFSAQIYGRDYTKELKTNVSVGEGVKLPVFGARINSDKATMAIVTSGAESGLIEATAGSTAIDYSSVYTTFQVRGNTEHTAQVFVGKESESMVYSTLTVKKPYTVRFYPLTGADADYNGMAECYRNYLKSKKKLTESKEEFPLTVTFIGGTMVTKSFLGIPYKSLYTTTTLAEAEDIVSDLYKKVGTAFPVTLKGFGESGVDIGEVAGGFKVNKESGGKKALKSLNELCKKNGNLLYMDFDLVRFSESSNGFSTGSDTVYDATDKKSLQYLYNPSTRDYNEKTKHYLLRHNQLLAASEKLISKAEDLPLNGISLSTLSNMLYSDYKDKTVSDYYCAVGTEKVVSNIFNAVKKSGKSVMANNANSYAAVNADIITDAAVTSSGENIFFAEIPFYQMIFKGYVPMYTSSQNLSENYKKLLLKSVESGCGLNYTVTAKWDNCLIDAAHPVFYNSVYDEISGLIVENHERLEAYYKAINGAHIVSHKILNNNVRETVFDNNVSVYVNLSESTVSSPAGDITPYDFIVKEGQ